MPIGNTKHSRTADEQLMLLVCQKDESAFRELYRRYSKPIHRYFYRMLYQDPEIANDATQEIFIRVFEKANLFDRNQKFQTWLFSVANNHCKNVYRKNARTPQKISLESSQDFISEEENKDDSFPRTQFNHALKTALQSLPENQRNLFVLRYQEAFSISEIAEITQTAEGTIKSGMHRILKKLSAELAPFHPKNSES